MIETSSVPRLNTLSTLSKVHIQLLLAANNVDGRIRIIDQNTGTRAIAETQSMASVISLDIRDGYDSEESFLLVLDTSHDLTIWSIKPWKVDSADVPYISISIMVNS